MERYLKNQIIQDLKKKMVFVGGPRQVGKTTLALSLLNGDPNYLNWDVREHRQRILQNQLPTGNLLVFDEIHKYKDWRNYLKGLFDLQKATIPAGAPMKQQMLVTGSARLDFYRRGGDSLQGRYHYLRLHPLSAAELKLEKAEDFTNLLILGGFPEPYFGQSQTEAIRWSKDHQSRIVNEELTSIERVEDVGTIELLAMRLPEMVGSPLSINTLSKELQKSFASIAKWVKILERMYMVFRIPPFGPPRTRAVKKEQKHYHTNWADVSEPAARFENLVASHLLKWVHYESDTKGRDLELRYFRDVDGREVDFVVLENKKPLMFVEAKSSDADIDRSLKYLKTRFPQTETWQISATGTKDYQSKEGIRVAPALKLLRNLV